jgi:hypothetical protein
VTNDDYQKKFNDIIDEMKKISFSRHIDYGGDSIFKYGMKMRFADIWRKYARLENLIWYQNKISDERESVRDTLIDLANYAVIALIVYDEEKEF